MPLSSKGAWSRPLWWRAAVVSVFLLAATVLMFQFGEPQMRKGSLRRSMMQAAHGDSASKITDEDMEDLALERNMMARQLGEAKMELAMLKTALADSQALVSTLQGSSQAIRGLPSSPPAGAIVPAVSGQTDTPTKATGLVAASQAALASMSATMGSSRPPLPPPTAFGVAPAPKEGSKATAERAKNVQVAGTRDSPPQEIRHLPPAPPSAAAHEIQQPLNHAAVEILGASAQPAIAVSGPPSMNPVVDLSSSAASTPGLSQELRDLHVTKHDFHAAPVEGASQLPVAVVVQNREQVIGCHSFERFLSPSWETFYVLQEEYAAAWKIGDVIRSRPTKGAHLLALSVPTGEWIARAAALQALDEVGREPPLLLSLMCDIQMLPAWHALHTPFQAVAERWVRDFLVESQQRREGRTQAHALSTQDFKLANSNLDECKDVFQTETPHELLAMNTPLLETLPDAESLHEARFHSKDVGQWVESTRKGRQVRGRMKDRPANEPWLSDVSLWTEDHAIMYNATLLRRFVFKWRLAVGTTAAGVKLIPKLCCRERLATVRHNDLPLFYDRAWPTLHAIGGPGGERTQLFDASKYAGVDMNFLKLYNFRLLSDVASPAGCMRESLAMAKYTGHAVDIACLIPMRHYHEFHMPHWESLAPEAQRTVVLQLLRVLGYSVLAEDADSWWLWNPFWHGYPVQWADTKSKRRAGSDRHDDSCVGPVARSASPAGSTMGLCAKHSQPAAKAKLSAAAVQRQKAHEWKEKSSKRASRKKRKAAETPQVAWLAPTQDDLLRIDRNTSLVDLRYPAFEWSNWELPAETALTMGRLICEAISTLRQRQQQGGGVFRHLSGAGVPSFQDQDFLNVLGEMEPYC